MGIIDSAIDSFKSNAQCVCIDIDTEADDNEFYESDSETIEPVDDIKENDYYLTPKMSIFEGNLSSSLSWDEPMPSDLQTLFDRQESCDSLSQSSKKTMHLVHMIASILKEYFQSPANQCEFSEIEVSDILQHIHIIGDSPRNYLLGIAMENTVDIIVNTRELTKMHLQHLNRHHHTEQQQTSYSQCILWNHYLNKLDTTVIQSDIALRNKYENNASKIADAMRSIEYISESAYILNAKFLSSVLTQSMRFENKLSVYQHKNCSSYQMQIIDELRYGKGDDISLNGYTFHIFDHHSDIYSNIITKREKLKSKIKEFHASQREKLMQYKQRHQVHLFMDDMIKTPSYDENAPHHMRISTRRVFDPSDIQGIDGWKRVEFMIAKSKSSLTTVIRNYDVSLNFFVIPFSNIVDSANNVDEADHEIEIDYDWNGKIKNGVHKYNAFKDLEEQIITHPFPDKMVENIKNYAPYIYFWRLIKICMQCVEYQIDDKIVRIIKHYYKDWIQNKQFLIDGHGDNDKVYGYGYEDLLDALFDGALCSSWIAFKTMLEKFEIFNFNTVLISVLRKSNEFKKRFIEELNDQDNDVVDLFEEYKYPID